MYYTLFLLAVSITFTLCSSCKHKRITNPDEKFESIVKWAFMDEIAENDFVLINNVLWATRNVGAHGNFTNYPEEKGILYQWRQNSMDGYRMPTVNEFYSLLDTINVLQVWTSINGVQGAKFVDKSNGNMIFLPITYGDEKLYPQQDSIFGIYWSNTLCDNTGIAYCMVFHRETGLWIQASRCEKKHPIRCVLDKGAFLLEELSVPPSIKRISK